MAYEFELIEVVQRGRVATVTIDNPPVNVITMALLAELIALSTALKADPDLCLRFDSRPAAAGKQTRSKQ